MIPSKDTKNKDIKNKDSKNKVLVRAATSADIEALSRLFQGYCQFYNTEPSLASCRDFVSQRLIKKDSLILLAELNNQPVGFVQIYYSFSSVAMKEVWILNDLFVDNNFRKKGIARALLLDTEKKASDEGVFTIKLATQISNEKAKNLYHQLGYQLNNTFDHFSKIITKP